MFNLDILFNFVRKVKMFNKSRYSRNRQNVKVTFYFGIYFNILIIYLIYSIIYSLTFKFTYIWWLYYILLLSFIGSSFLKLKKY